MLAVGCSPSLRRAEAEGRCLLQSLCLLAVGLATDLQSVLIEPGPGLACLGCRAACKWLGWGLMSQISTTPGEQHEAKLALASVQADRPGGLLLLGREKKIRGMGGNGCFLR